MLWGAAFRRVRGLVASADERFVLFPVALHRFFSPYVGIHCPLFFVWASLCGIDGYIAGAAASDGLIADYSEYLFRKKPSRRCNRGAYLFNAPSKVLGQLKARHRAVFLECGYHLRSVDGLEFHVLNAKSPHVAGLGLALCYRGTSQSTSKLDR